MGAVLYPIRDMLPVIPMAIIGGAIYLLLLILTGCLTKDMMKLLMKPSKELETTV
jgi:hypothetical protein